MNRLSHIWLIAVIFLIGYTGTTGSQEGGKQPLRLVQTISLFLTRSSLTVGPTASSTNLILNLSMSVTVVRTQGRTTERLESSTQRKTSTSAISKLWPTPLSFCWTGRERRFLCSLPLPT